MCLRGRRLMRKSRSRPRPASEQADSLRAQIHYETEECGHLDLSLNPLRNAQYRVAKRMDGRFRAKATPPTRSPTLTQLHVPYCKIGNITHTPDQVEITGGSEKPIARYHTLSYIDHLHIQRTIIQPLQPIVLSTALTTSSPAPAAQLPAHQPPRPQQPSSKPLARQ